MTIATSVSTKLLSMRVTDPTACPEDPPAAMLSPVVQLTTMISMYVQPQSQA